MSSGTTRAVSPAATPRVAGHVAFSIVKEQGRKRASLWARESIFKPLEPRPLSRWRGRLGSLTLR